MEIIEVKLEHIIYTESFFGGRFQHKTQSTYVKTIFTYLQHTDCELIIFDIYSVRVCFWFV